MSIYYNSKVIIALLLFIIILMVYINKPLLELSGPSSIPSPTGKEEKKNIKTITDPLQNTLNYNQEANLNSIYVELNYMIRENITTSLVNQNGSSTTVSEIFNNDTIIRRHSLFNHIFNATRNDDPYNQITTCKNVVVQLVKFLYSYIATEEVLNNLESIDANYVGLFKDVTYQDATTGASTTIDLTDVNYNGIVGNLIDIAKSSKLTHEYYIHSVLIGSDGFNCFKMLDIVNLIGTSLTATYNNTSYSLKDRFPGFMDPINGQQLYVTQAPTEIVANLNSIYTQFKNITNYDGTQEIDFSNMDVCRIILENNPEFDNYSEFDDDAKCAILHKANNYLPADITKGQYAETYSAFNGIKNSISDTIENN